MTIRSAGIRGATGGVTGRCLSSLAPVSPLPSCLSLSYDFGFAWAGSGPPRLASGFLAFAGNIVSGLLLFIPAGILAGLLSQWLLRGSVGRWRIVLIGAVVLATPVAIVFSLAGGLLGPPGVVIGATAPYLIIVGIPALLARG